MFRSRLSSTLAALTIAVAVGAGGTGCHSMPLHGTPPPEPIPDLQLPKELNKVTLPTYTIESPDILVIESTRTIPLPPYKVQPLDALYLVVPDDQPLQKEEPIRGIYPIDPDGTINLGPSYGGTIPVSDMTVPDIQKKLTTHLRKLYKDASITVSLAASGRGTQQIAGQHLVRPDGTVGLGIYGSVYVAGMSLQQAKQAIEQHLTRFLYRPEVSVDVFSFNSKWYYVITDFAGSGEQVARLPCTGNETVLDAIAQVGGLSAVSSKKLWVARPAPAGTEDQILPVDWKGITRRGKTSTNYQVLPGDRIFVMSQPLAKFDTYFGRALAPVERAFGFTLLGSTTISELTGRNLQFQQGNQ
jgi:polysaccharide biosynthesis/export protein